MRIELFTTPRHAVAALAIYAGLLLGTLGQTPQMVKWISDAGYLKEAVLICAVLALGAVIFFSARAGRLKEPSLWITLGLSILVYLAVVKLTPKTPVERFHLITYGILALLVFSAGRFILEGMKLYAASGGITAATGALDEIIQHFLPNRVFDWKDIVINAVGGVVMLAIIRFAFGDRGGKQ